MNFYPSWIQRIPEMLEALALLPDERIDRRRAEELFDLRRSAAHKFGRASTPSAPTKGDLSCR
jgi:hypothetical protein